MVRWNSGIDIRHLLAVFITRPSQGREFFRADWKAGDAAGSRCIGAAGKQQPSRSSSAPAPDLLMFRFSACPAVSLAAINGIPRRHTVSVRWGLRYLPPESILSGLAMTAEIIYLSHASNARAGSTQAHAPSRHFCCANNVLRLD